MWQTDNNGQTIHTECLMGTGICYENDIIALPCSHKHLLPLGHDDKVCDPFCFLFVFGLSILWSWIILNISNYPVFKKNDYREDGCKCCIIPYLMWMMPSILTIPSSYSAFHWRLPQKFLLPIIFSILNNGKCDHLIYISLQIIQIQQ